MVSLGMSKKLPELVIARWDAEDWDDDNMIARKYRYEALGDGPIDLTDDEALLYTWGQTEDNITGGSQVGRLGTEME